MDLPHHIKIGLEQRLHGVSRRDLAQRSARLTQAYRNGGTSDAVIVTPDDALAYAVARMPATYAAIATALSHTAARLTDFQPRSLLDLGSGPGTASFAALELWPGIDRVTMVERNAQFRTLARELADASGVPALVGAAIIGGDLAARDTVLPAADLVIAAYMLIEQREAAVPAMAHALLARSRRALVLIEPGTPAGFARIRAARDELMRIGAVPVAPCPHVRPCPIVSPDWCHFSVRLARSRDHKLAKSVDAPFEDEKFSYLAVERGIAATSTDARIISPPRRTKGETTLRLCTSGGIVEHRVARRDKLAWKAASRLDWGDLLRDTHSRTGGES